MAQKPSVPKGTRDFSAIEMSRRNYIFDTIRDAFRMFGYMQIETPAMENLSVLMGKYGEEGDKLLFKILNSGDFLKNTDISDFEERRLNVLLPKMCEKGLRYDLTVPFARYVVMHRNDIQLPFKRFQIQPVWRADRPQKGRYREFYQCDADIVGSDSLNNEVELIQLLDFVFKRLGIRICIKLNNRKILSGIAEVLGASDKLIDITVAIDKIDKVGLDNVNKELVEKGMTEEQLEKLHPFLTLSGSNKEKLDRLSEALSASEQGLKGIEELRYVVELTDRLGHESEVEVDVSLARGLNYYTGTIIEVKALYVEMGSISGGGRYDNLTGVFGMPGLSGVGISFGADRIYDVLNQLNLYPDNLSPSVKVLFANLGEKESVESLKLIKKLHDIGISCKLFPDCSKLKKQMSVANAENIPYVALIGDKELEDGTLTLKNMADGSQEILTHDELIEKLKV